MEPEGRYTIIGALLLLLVACAVAAGIWLTGYVGGSLRYYTIYFERQSLLGLQIGGEVNTRGLKIGQVEDYSFSRDNVNRVKVDIRVDSGTPVSVDTTASIGRNLVTGVARIDLNTPNPAAKPLAVVPPGESYPVIPEGTSEFDQISDSFNRIAVTGEAALANLRDLLNDDNRKALTETLLALRALSGGLESRLATIDSVGQAMARTVETFEHSAERITATVQKAGGDFDARLAPLAGQAARTLADVQRLTADARKTLSTIAGTATALENQTSRAAGKVADSADLSVLELRATARELRVGIDNLNRTLERYQDPRAILLGPSDAQLGPGEKSAR